MGPAKNGQRQYPDPGQAEDRGWRSIRISLKHDLMLFSSVARCAGSIVAYSFEIGLLVVSLGVPEC